MDSEYLERLREMDPRQLTSHEARILRRSGVSLRRQERDTLLEDNYTLAAELMRLRQENNRLQQEIEVARQRQQNLKQRLEEIQVPQEGQEDSESRRDRRWDLEWE